MEVQPTIAVVILNWNGKKLLEGFLPALLATDYPDVRIVVGDNASTDDSVHFLKTHYPSVEIISLPMNFGFAAGYNRVLAEISADFFILLNSDVEVTKNWIAPVIDFMQAQPIYAACQPKILSYKNKQNFEYAGAAGGYVDKNGFFFCRGRIFDQVEVDEGQYDDTREVFWASGAAFFIRSQDFNQAGGFDETLFAHMEEIDLCWRLQIAGRKIGYVPDATVYHVGGGTLEAINPMKMYLNFRNNLVILHKNLSAREKMPLMFTRIFLDFIAYLRFMVLGDFDAAFAINRAHWYFFKNLARLRKQHGNVNPPSIRTLAGYYKRSIVADYFIKKISKFKDLPL